MLQPRMQRQPAGAHAPPAHSGVLLCRLLALLAVLPAGATAAADALLPSELERLRDALWVRVEMIAFARDDTGAAPVHLVEHLQLPNQAIARVVAPPEEPLHGCGYGPTPPALPPLLTPAGRPERPAWMKPIPHPDCEGIGEQPVEPRTYWPAIPVTAFGNDFHSAALHACFEDGRAPRFPPATRAVAEPDEETLAQWKVQELAQTHYEALREATLQGWSALRSLQGVRDTLARRFRVLAGGAWQQRAEPPRSATSMLVQLGPQSADGRHEIEGTLRMTARPYPQFEVLLTRALPGGGLALMQENRRLADGELHYLDHPAFGLLVQIDPIEEPPELGASAVENGAGS